MSGMDHPYIIFWCIVSLSVLWFIGGMFVQSAIALRGKANIAQQIAQAEKDRTEAVQKLLEQCMAYNLAEQAIRDEWQQERATYQSAYDAVWRACQAMYDGLKHMSNSPRGLLPSEPWSLMRTVNPMLAEIKPFDLQFERPDVAKKVHPGDRPPLMNSPTSIHHPDDPDLVDEE